MVVSIQERCISEATFDRIDFFGGSIKRKTVIGRNIVFVVWLCRVLYSCSTVSEEQFATFPPFSKKMNMYRNDIVPLMQEYADSLGSMSRQRRMVISSFEVKNGTVITPVRLSNLELELICRKIYRIVQYTHVKAFNGFVQSTIDAQRQTKEDTDSSVNAKTMKIHAKISYGHQFIDRRCDSVTKYL